MVFDNVPYDGEAYARASRGLRESRVEYLLDVVRSYADAVINDNNLNAGSAGIRSPINDMSRCFPGTTSMNPTLSMPRRPALPDI